VPVFSPAHLLLLFGICISAIALAALCRHHWISERATRLAVGIALTVNELIWFAFRYSHEGIHLKNLPLQLCDVTLWVSIAACFTIAPLAIEFAYFAGIAGAGMALLTPDLWSPWPSYPAIYFFVAHGGVVLACAVLVFGHAGRLRAGALPRASALLLVYAAAVGSFDAITGANYMYLRQKPRNVSILEWFGPWPWYLGGALVLALILFGLMWLPVRPRERAGA
jgi:hypothetical integral membrane protein (TIGR02206 family)